MPSKEVEEEEEERVERKSDRREERSELGGRGEDAGFNVFCRLWKVSLKLVFFFNAVFDSLCENV